MEGWPTDILLLPAACTICVQEKQELEDFQRETQLAIEDELRMLSR